MTTFDEPDGVQRWESDSRRRRRRKFWAESVQKVDFLQKLGLASELGLGLGLAFKV